MFACHPDQILTVLGDSASAEESKALGMFNYRANDTYVHWDDSLMPKAKSAWTSWNYIGSLPTTNTSKNSSSSEKPVFVTYWINKLQHIEHSKNLFVSLNPHVPPAADKTFVKLNYSHPQYTIESMNLSNYISNCLYACIICMYVRVKVCMCTYV